MRSPNSSPVSCSTFKRPRVDRENQLSQAQNSLERLLSEKSLCVLNHDHGPHIITNHHELQWHLERRLKANPGLLQEFVHDLSVLFEDDSAFRKALQATTASAEDEICSVPVANQNYSLVRVLLGVPCLQQHVCEAILGKLPEFAGDQDSSSLLTDVPRLIVHQLQFLDNIYNETHLCEKLLELLDVCQVSLQKEILSAIPDILSNSSHSRIVSALQLKLDEDVSLTINILDTLSNLDLETEMMESVRGIALKALETLPVADLPIITRFIIQSLAKKNAEKTLDDVLKRLRLVGITQKVASKKVNADEFLLILDQFRLGISYHKHIAPALIKCLQKLQNSELSPIVIWLLLMLNGQSVHSNRVVKIVRRWIQNDTQGIVTQQFETFINEHIQGINLTGKSILHLAEETVRSTDSSEQHIGEILYQSAFENVAMRVDILSCLATHIGSGRNHEIEKALQILLQFCCDRSMEMSPYFAYLLGLLDYCHNLSNFQCRTLFKALAKVQSCNEGNNLKTELVNFITKNIQHATLSFQRPAIIGALCIINAYAPKGQCFDETHPIFSLLADLNRYTSKSHVATAFLCEEILYYLNRGCINEDVVFHLIDRIVQLFKNTFLVSPEDQSYRGPELIRVVPLFGLEPNIRDCISIFPGLANPTRRPAFSLLPSSLELLYRWSQYDEGAAPDEDGFSSMALLLFDLECLNDLRDFDDSLLKLSFSSLLLGINWFRALLNSFAVNPDPILRWKCTRYLSFIIELLHGLARYPSDFVSTIIPYGISQYQRITLSSQKEMKQKKSADDVLPCRIEPLLRPFAGSVFTLLALPLKLELASNDPNDSTTNRVPFLYLDTFHFLLRELHDVLKRNYIKPFSFKLPNSSSNSTVMAQHLDYFEFFAALNYTDKSKDAQTRIFRSLGKSLLLLNSHDRVHEDNSSFISRNAELILHVMEFLLNCSVLQTSPGRKILTIMLLDFIQCPVATQPMMGFNSCLEQFGNFLLDLLPLSNSPINFQTKICSIVENLLKRCSSCPNALSSKLSDCALKLLTQQRDNRSSLDSSIGVLLSCYIKNSSVPLEVVERIITTELSKFFERQNSNSSFSQDAQQLTFSQTLTLTTWPYFFKSCAEQLIGSMNAIERDVSSLLKKLERCAKLFSSLLGFVQCSQKAVILSSAVRFGQMFMDRIISHVPLMKSTFKENKEEVLSLINIVPKTTRILQRICSHVKRNKISNLSGSLPALKKSMEKYLYLVKDLFYYHGILHTTEFKCAALKNRTIDGREIREEEEETEEEEEEEEEERGEEAQEPDDQEGSICRDGEEDDEQSTTQSDQLGEHEFHC